MSNAITSTSSCCYWLPCCFSPEKDIESGLKSRVCPYWRIIPGSLACIASVTAIVCALLWNCPYLCIAFAPGALASLYLMYLGWEFHNLTTFAENNNQLENSIQELRAEKEALEKQLVTFKDENDKLQKAVANLKTLAENLQRENTTLTNSNQTLKRTIDDLEQLKKTLEEKAQLHVTNLFQLQASLKGIEEATKEDHEKFTPNLKLFIEEVKKLQLTREQFEQTGTETEKKMKEQVDILLDSASMLETIFIKINDWKNGKEAQALLNIQKDLNTEITHLKTQLAAEEAKLKEQAKHVQALSELQEGFKTALGKLLEQLESLKDTQGKLNKDAEIVSDVVKQMQRYATVRKED